MPHNPDKHHRRSIRLKGYDYAQPGAYFVTLCTHARACLFGAIVEGDIRLNTYGAIVGEEWLRTAAIRREIALDVWVIMPNHFHAVVWIVSLDDGDCRGARPCAPTEKPSRTRIPSEYPPGVNPKSLAALIRGFKSSVTTRINHMRGTPGAPVWQRNYYEHVVRDDDDLHDIREYVAFNPTRWEDDPENIANQTGL
jgi:putative transposase